jgi:NADPH:quinone reductase
MIASRGKTMRAVVIDRFGGPEVISIRTIPLPEPKPDQVLIRVKSAAVSVWEPAEREGMLAKMQGITPQFPWILGSEGAGEVTAVGERARDFKVGDRVYGITWGVNPHLGFFAEYAALDAEWVIAAPSSIPMEQAGALLIDGAVALRGVDEILQLKPDEKLLVFGASGGVGHLAVQLAKRMGARVFGVASGEDGVDMVERLEAEIAVDGHSGDVISAARKFAPGGFDAALFTAGGESANRVLTAMRDNSRVAHPFGVQLAGVPSTVRELSYMESTYWQKLPRQLLGKLNEMIDSGPLEVHIDIAFSLDRVLDAYRALDSHYLGKLALLPAE